jgi:hypothetical protein
VSLKAQLKAGRVVDESLAKLAVAQNDAGGRPGGHLRADGVVGHGSRSHQDVDVLGVREPAQSPRHRLKIVRKSGGAV